MTEHRSISIADALAALRAKMEEDRPPAVGPVDSEVCFWCKQPDCKQTCLGVPNQMKTSDPAYWMLTDGHATVPSVHDPDCYICNDPEFATMGLPLCKPCPKCTAAPGDEVGHIPADDESCDACQFNLRLFYEVGEDMAAYDRTVGSETA